MKTLKWFIAQTLADIEANNSTIVELENSIKELQEEQIELAKVLKKLKAK